MRRPQPTFGAMAKRIPHQLYFGDRHVLLGRAVICANKAVASRHAQTLRHHSQSQVRVATAGVLAGLRAAVHPTFIPLGLQMQTLPDHHGVKSQVRATFAHHRRRPCGCNSRLTAHDARAQ